MALFKPCVLTFICLICFPLACLGWLAAKPTTTQRTIPMHGRTQLHFGSADQGSSNSDEAVRMAFVRSLQMQFYKNCTNSELDLSQGMIYNLPLWRVPWVEVPGRTNVLNVHESHYTNMMETILHSEPPWYVGHLYLPGGSDNIKSEDPMLKLETWQEQVADKVTRKDPMQRAAALGTLLRISDYRRLQDGRLLILVQAIERFVVSEVVQNLPYGVAHVQFLPDADEVDSELSWISSQTEDGVAAARALALKESFERWHRYEFENTMLPLPMRSDLKPEEIVGSALAQVLPFASFSPVMKAETLLTEQAPDIPKETRQPSNGKMTKTLEQQLLKGRILRIPVELDESLLLMTTEELEIQLWLAINQFLKTTRTPVSPVILGLLPHRREWPGTFVLERIGSAIGDQTQLEHKYIRTSEHYPAGRRQKRFSYCAAALLEHIDSVSDFRYAILSLPSTKHRLAYVLQHFQEKFDYFQ
jgi:Lon protease-like protein